MQQFFSDMDRCSTACISRDSQGMFVEAITNCWEGQVAPELAQLIGIQDAPSWIKRKNWQNVVLETDSLLCVQALRSQAQFPSYFGSLIMECIAIRKELHNIFLVFVKRSANQVAHELARASCVHAGCIQEVGVLPPFIFSILLKDME